MYKKSISIIIPQNSNLEIYDFVEQQLLNAREKMTQYFLISIDNALKIVCKNKYNKDGLVIYTSSYIDVEGKEIHVSEERIPDEKIEELVVRIDNSFYYYCTK